MMVAKTVPPPHPRANTAAQRDAFGLSTRERQVADCLADGMRTDEIACLLGLTVNSVQTYVKRALKVTGTHHRGELIARVTGRLHV